MAIPLVDVAWQHQQVRGGIDQALDRLLTDTTCDGEEFVSALESAFARRMGKGVYAVAVQSGLAAEFLTLRALGIGPGDEVITVPNSDIATTAAISHAGATFTLVDIDPRTHNIDPAKIEAAITLRTRAIIPVHMYGLPAELDAIRDIARRHGLRVIEDATLALGAEYRALMAGTVGDAGFFSFSPRKVLGGAGNGGMVVTRDQDIARTVRGLRAYGLPPERAEASVAQRLSFTEAHHVVEGYNLKLDPIQAAVIGPKFAQLDAWAVLRQQIADRYGERLDGVPGIETPHEPDLVRHAWRNYVITIPERDRVRTALRDKGIASAVLYTPPVHLQPVYHRLGFGPGSFPNAEAVAQRLLALPMYPGLTDEQVDEVADVLVEVVRAA